MCDMKGDQAGAVENGRTADSPANCKHGMCQSERQAAKLGTIGELVAIRCDATATEMSKNMNGI
jgi:hypothetical protein